MIIFLDYFRETQDSNDENKRTRIRAPTLARIQFVAPHFQCRYELNYLVNAITFIPTTRIDLALRQTYANALGKHRRVVIRASVTHRLFGSTCRTLWVTLSCATTLKREISPLCFLSLALSPLCAGKRHKFSTPRASLIFRSVFVMYFDRFYYVAVEIPQFTHILLFFPLKKKVIAPVCSDGEGRWRRARVPFIFHWLVGTKSYIRLFHTHILSRTECSTVRETHRIRLEFL